MATNVCQGVPEEGEQSQYHRHTPMRSVATCIASNSPKQNETIAPINEHHDDKRRIGHVTLEHRQMSLSPSQFQKRGYSQNERMPTAKPWGHSPEHAQASPVQCANVSGTPHQVKPAKLINIATTKTNGQRRTKPKSARQANEIIKYVTIRISNRLCTEAREAEGSNVATYHTHEQPCSDEYEYSWVRKCSDTHITKENWH